MPTANQVIHISLNIGNQNIRSFRFELAQGQSVTIGRADDNTISIPSKLVSRHHGVLRFFDGRLEYADLQSTNGTLVGNVFVRGTNDGGHIPSSQWHSVELPAVLKFDSIKASLNEHVELLISREKNLQARRVPLDPAREYTIGRDASCTICLPRVYISRVHAIIRMERGRWIITDHHSTNGLSVNSSPVRGSVELKEHDVIRIGLELLVFMGSYLEVIESGRKGVQLDVRGLSKVVTDRNGLQSTSKTLLNNISLSIQPGELIAIVGGSGAGKTTLLNAICGYTAKSSGTITVDGQDFDQNYATIKSIIGYVPQQDIVFDSMPLQRMLDYAAQMRMPQDTTPKERQKRIDDVLAMVKLSEHKKTVIRKLSGGQRKRASIAVELLADPSLFFLDEPTSGLDAGTEESLMQSLRDLSRQGKTVVLVTHSTLKLDICDRIIAMGRGGRLCYMGHASGAPAFFGVERMPQIYDKLDNESVKWEKVFAQSRHATAVSKPKQTVRGNKSVTGFTQYRILTTRYADILMRNPKQIMGMVGQALVFALVLTLVSGDGLYTEFGGTQTVQFVTACLGMWMGLFLSIQEITKERGIIRREYMANLKLAPYVLSKATVLGVLAAMQTIVLQVATALLSMAFDKNLPDTSLLMPPLLENGITLWLVNFASVCMGLTVSALSKQPERIAPYVLMPQIVLAGVLFDLGDGVFSKVSRLVFTYWGNRALCISADVNELGRAQAAAQPEIPGVENTFKAVEDYTSTVSNLQDCWLALTILSVVLLLATMLFLRRLSEDDRG